MITPLTDTRLRRSCASTPLSEQPICLLRWLDVAGRGTSGGGPPAGANHLIAAPAQIPDRCAPHVDQSREREDQEDCHTEKQVRLEDWVGIGHQHPGLSL